MIELLLNNGADTSVPNEFNEQMVSLLDKSEVDYSKEDCKQAKQLLNPNNPPYLKLGEAKEDKYIIYENQKNEPFLLADIQEHKDKKYLYSDSNIALFVYWCYKNNLLIEEVNKVIKIYKKTLSPLSSEKLLEMFKNIIDTKLTINYFNEKGKAFAIGYLTVTSWWYSWFFDLKKLYPKDENFPKTLDSKDEFEQALKLLDLRYKQFISQKDFNPNQTKEELITIIS